MKNTFLWKKKSSKKQKKERNEAEKVTKQTVNVLQ